MSKLSGPRRKLNPQKVWLANKVAEEKIKIARQVVLERAKKDAEFAADVLKAVGENLPEEIKKACEKSVNEKVNSASSLPEDPLIIQNAPPSNYPENQGMGAAFGKLVQEEGPRVEKSNDIPIDDCIE